MTEASLSENELNFALEALRNNIPICFIRPKCDLDMEDRLDDEQIKEINQRTVVEFLQEINDKFLRELVSKNEALKKVPYFFISNKVLYNIVTKKPTPYRFMENRLLDHLINTIKNQRHIIDACYEDYGLEGGDIRQESGESVINPLEDVN
uniref:Uncharacterized protein n=1 Tax=Acrobeloides nanus TaxID=290746 RepID=A0A914D6Y5_9BILA